MNRPYRFGKVYAVLNLLGAVYSGWLAYQMLWYGFFWAAVLGALGVPLGAITGIGLWRKRRYGYYLLMFGIVGEVAFNIYGWFRPSEVGKLYRVGISLLTFVVMGVIFAYFYKRRQEFT